MWTYRVEDRTHYEGPLKINKKGEAIFVMMDPKGRDYTYFLSSAVARRVCRSCNV